MLPRVLLLTDRHQLPEGRDLVETVRRCVDAGLEAVVVRELDLPEERRAALAQALAATGCTVVSARTLLPAAVGVHLAATQDPPPGVPDLLHGRSCHDDDEVRRAVAEGASYVTVSPVAPTVSKPGYGPPLGLAGVRSAVAAAGPVPLFALGGVDAQNAATLRAAGAHGVAVMGAVMRAADPAALVRSLHEQGS